jgi:hypothetical protein
VNVTVSAVNRGSPGAGRQIINQPAGPNRRDKYDVMARISDRNVSMS